MIPIKLKDGYSIPESTAKKWTNGYYIESVHAADNGYYVDSVYASDSRPYAVILTEHGEFELVSFHSIKARLKRELKG